MTAQELSQESFRTLVESAVPTISDYSVGFALPTAVNGSIDACLGGSGTLVTIDGIDGILTATHVINELEKAPHVGLILPSPTKSTPHHPPIELEHCRRITFALGAEESDGPDLELLIPSLDVVAALRATKSFYNLSKRQTRMVEQAPRTMDGFWLLSGMASEWTSEGHPEPGFPKVKIFRGKCGAIKISKEYELDDFDYVICEVLYNELYEGPEKYGGYSGGGLWQVLVQPDGEDLKISKYLLSGVAYYESAKMTNDAGQTIREIKCHGKKSLYEALLTKVRAECLAR